VSYIEDVLHGKQNNSEIIAFLKEEGFKSDTGPLGQKGMVYVTSGDYTVWFTVREEVIDLYIEYNCGGAVSEPEFHFEQDDFDSFKEAYKNAVDCAKRYI
jgi:hypothetical protein